MARIVQKFGGTSVADIERIENAASRVKREVDAGNEVAVVVSAMAGTTNQLVEWTRRANRLHDAQDKVFIVADGCGEGDALAVIARDLFEGEELAGQCAVSRLHALQLGFGAVRHDRVERQGREIEVEMARQDGKPALQRHQRVVLGLLVLRLGARRTDDRLHAKQHLAGLRLAAVVDDMVLWAERRGTELLVVTPDPLKEPQVRQIQKRHEDLGLANYSLDDFQGVLAGLDDARRETLGLGVVRSIDFAKQTMVIETQVPEAEIVAVRLGRHKLK